jgi:hypothetical protein
MICPKCKSDQLDTAQFCSQCSEPLTERGQKVARSKNPAWAWVVLILGLLLLAFFAFRNLKMAEDSKQALQRAMARQGQTAPRPPQPHFVPITNGAAAVPAASYSWYTFVVPQGASIIAVNGHFSATGGTGNDIECYIIDEDGLANFKNGHLTTTYFNSGKVTQAKIGAILTAPGSYYLVMDNRFSLFTPKAVQIDATLSYEQ